MTVQSVSFEMLYVNLGSQSYQNITVDFSHVLLEHLSIHRLKIQIAKCVLQVNVDTMFCN